MSESKPTTPEEQPSYFDAMFQAALDVLAPEVAESWRESPDHSADALEDLRRRAEEMRDAEVADEEPPPACPKCSAAVIRAGLAVAAAELCFSCSDSGSGPELPYREEVS